MAMLLFFILSGIAISISGDDTVYLSRQNCVCLFGSNVIRQVHSVNHLFADETLFNDAEDWAIRMALKNAMVFSGKGHGENLFASQGKYANCSYPLFSWYGDIKNFDYDNPKWTYSDGTFIQEVYDKVNSSGFGIASYKNNLYAAGMYDYAIYTSDPMDEKHVPKPSREITEDDLKPNGKCKSLEVISVPIPPKGQVWTDWIATSSCSTNCETSSSVEERWCVHGDFLKDCVGERKRIVQCKAENCSNECQDLHKDCQDYARKRKYCKNQLFFTWMAKNCPVSCGLCNRKDFGRTKTVEVSLEI